MTNCHPEPSDFFFEVSSAESAETTLRALADTWPATVLTELHYITNHGHKPHLVGASFAGQIAPETVTTVTGHHAKLTELTLKP